MANPSQETVAAPFTAFNFAVELHIPELTPLACNASFSECEGLEMSHEVKTLREGGNNSRQIRLTGPVSYGQLTLKRGMTANFDLWHWFTALQERPQLRADGEVVLLAPDGVTERVRFILSRCVPVKLRAPSLHSREGLVAIEELQLAYEALSLKPPAGGL